jgi:flagellar FliJ protein
MTNPSALDTLIELASTATDKAAKKLGFAIRASDDAAQKLALLTQYRDEYAARFQAGMVGGLTASEYRNFRQFIDKLDSAIDGQNEVVRQARKRVEAERSAWQETERKRLSYGTLATRAQQQEQLQQNKREQKETDEHAARSAYAKR